MNKLIVRTDLNELEKQGTLYFLEGVAFTGEAYDQDQKDCYLDKVYTMKDGVIVGERDYGFLGHSGLVKIRADELEPGEYDFLPNTFNEEPFTGLVYDYFGPFCSEESWYVDGFKKESVTWVLGTGRAVSYSIFNHERNLEIQWRGGQIVHLTAASFIHPNTRLWFYGDDQGKVNRMAITGDYRLIDPLIPRDDLGLSFRTLDDLLKQKCFAEELELLYIADHIFLDWITLGYLDEVSSLILYRTKVSPQALLKVAQLPALKKITVWECHGYIKTYKPERAAPFIEREAQLQAALKQLVHERDDLTAFFNDGETERTLRQTAASFIHPDIDLWFKRDDQGKVNRMEITGDYRLIDPLIPRDDLGLSFHTLDDLLKQKCFAEEVELVYIDDHIFLDWITLGYLDEVSSLILNETKVSPQALLKVAQLPALKKITVWEYHGNIKLYKPERAAPLIERKAQLEAALKQLVHERDGLTAFFNDARTLRQIT